MPNNRFLIVMFIYVITRRGVGVAKPSSGRAASRCEHVPGAVGHRTQEAARNDRGTPIRLQLISYQY